MAAAGEEASLQHSGPQGQRLRLRMWSLCGGGGAAPAPRPPGPRACPASFPMAVPPGRTRGRCTQARAEPSQNLRAFPRHTEPRSCRSQRGLGAARRGVIPGACLLPPESPTPANSRRVPGEVSRPTPQPSSPASGQKETKTFRRGSCTLRSWILPSVRATGYTNIYHAPRAHSILRSSLSLRG